MTTPMGAGLSRTGSVYDQVDILNLKRGQIGDSGLWRLNQSMALQKKNNNKLDTLNLEWEENSLLHWKSYSRKGCISRKGFHKCGAN